MLRNIPNKVDQETLKSIVDETSRGCYDFMYLRIDFANSCKYVGIVFSLSTTDLDSVGYAFINFDDVSFPYFSVVINLLISLALAHHRRKWVSLSLYIRC